VQREGVVQRRRLVIFLINCVMLDATVRTDQGESPLRKAIVTGAFFLHLNRNRKDRR
jgi:hypothetical protein